jgi:hypothetical protein
MTILSNSWAQHLKSLAGNNEANKNIKAFTNTLAPSKTTNKLLNALVEEVDTAILLVGPKNSVQRTHSWAKFGEKKSRLDISIACLIGTGPRANAVTIDYNQAVALTTISIPSATDIAACKTVDNFVNLAANATFLGILKDGLAQNFTKLGLFCSFLGIMKGMDQPKKIVNPRSYPRFSWEFEGTNPPQN